MGLWYWLRLFVIGAVLLSTGWLGITEGWRSTADTTGQQVAIATQIAYGMTGLGGFALLLARSRIALPAIALWAIATTATATLAPVVWGGTPIRVAIFAGAVTAGIAALVLWGAHAHLAHISSPPREPGT